MRDLRVPAVVGVTDAERERPQTVAVRFELEVDARAAGSSDEMRDTVDYGSAAVRAADAVRRGEAKLLEHLAERIAGELLGMEGVVGVAVEVEKEKPPIPEDVRAVAVRIERR